MKKKIRSFISFIMAVAVVAGLIFPMQVQAAPKAGSTFSSVTNDAKNAAKRAKDKAGKAASKAKDAAEKAASKAKDKAGKAASEGASKAKKALNDAKQYAGTALDDLSRKADKAAADISKKAKEAKNAATEGMAHAAGGIAAAADSINADQIQSGFEFASRLSAVKSTVRSKTEIKELSTAISDAIEAMRNDLNKSANNGRGAAQEKGFVFEKWHADTYNIDAAAKKLDDRAWRLESNENASVDVQTTKGEKASAKAYKDGKESAKKQVERSGNQELWEGYRQFNQELENQGKDEISFQDYVDNHLSKEEINELFEAKYSGQTRLIPADQMDDAAAYINGKISELPETGEMSKADAKRYKEALNNLKDHIGDENGAQSKPLSSDDLQALTEMANEGKVDLDQFDIKVSNYISRADIVNEVLSAGSSAAVLEVAFTIGPDLYEIIVESLKSGSVDENKLKELGLDAALAGAGGFAEGSLSQAILVACETGKFGNKLKDVSPDTVGTIAVLTIDAAKYAYMLSKNEITPTDYANLMAEETFVAIGSQAGGVALQALFPMVPFAYLAGSMAGGMLASTGYQVTKSLVVEIKSEGGISAILPEKVTDGVAVGKEAIKEKLPKKITSEIANLRLTVNKKKQVKITQA